MSPEYTRMDIFSFKDILIYNNADSKNIHKDCLHDLGTSTPGIDVLMLAGDTRALDLEFY